MKKVMIGLAAIALSLGVQAAVVNWKLTTGGTTYAGMNVYAFTAADLATTSALDACKSTTADDWTTFFATGDKGTASGSGNRLAAGASTSGVATGESLTFVIVDGNVAEGSNYYVFNSVAIPDANVYEPPASGAEWNSLKAANLTLAGSGAFTAGSTPTPPGPGPVPEPTSGLLLLVGGAMLALRRKQK